MKVTFEEAQVLASTALLLPALVALIVLGWRRRLDGGGEECWDPRLTAERDWWSEVEHE